jgi:predicted nucleic acid binding AN1-type Zn finger protein
MADSTHKVTDQVPARCQHPQCRVKLTLASVSCKCKKYFCAKHRFQTDHACDFDFKAEGKRQLERYLSSPVIAAKVEAI